MATAKAVALVAAATATVVVVVVVAVAEALVSVVVAAARSCTLGQEVGSLKLAATALPGTISPRSCVAIRCHDHAVPPASGM